MALSTSQIAAVLDEIGPALQGGWIQKVFQPTADSLVFEIRTPGQTHRLLISRRPDTARLHLITQPLLNPPTPPPFCQYLRAHVQGARIEGLTQVPGDRIVELRLTTKTGPGWLVAQLTGTQANVFVLDQQRRVVRQLRQEPKLTGQPYVPPPARGSGAPSSIAPPLAHSGDSLFPLSAAIEASYREQETTGVLERAREARSHALKKQIKKEARRIEAWREDLQKAGAYRDYARYGELLKANLASIKKGLDRIVLIDYFDEALPEVTIPLDATKSAHGNMDDYFRKHRKYLTAERELQPRIVEAERGLDKMREELQAIQAGTWAPPASSPEPSPRLSAQRRPEGREAPRGPFRRFLSTDGIPIFVGRNARENDELTFGLAKSDDLWLHARGTPGSHVVVRLEKGKEPPAETLRDAATLALLYSDLKKSGKGDVVYTKRKWVKKAKGQAPGAVTVTQERSIHVSLDKKRLAQLKARSDR